MHTIALRFCYWGERSDEPRRAISEESWFYRWDRWDVYTLNGERERDREGEVCCLLRPAREREREHGQTMERNRVTFASGPVDSSTPLLLGNGESSSSGSGSDGSNNSSRRGGNNNRVQGAARYLRRAGSRRIMREPSMLVRESAAEQLEERQSDWAYSRPVVVLDLIWNLAFVQVALAVLTLSKEERPRTPLRVWVLGYALQCILHMLCVCCEYRRRRHQRRTSANPSSSSSSTNPSESPPFPASSEHDVGFDDDDAGPLAHTRSQTFFSFN